MEHDRFDELLSQGWPRGFAGSFRFSDTPHGSGDNAWFSFGLRSLFSETLLKAVSGLRLPQAFHRRV